LARRGTRLRQPADELYDNAYLFGAILSCSRRRAALALPHADADMMQLHLDEISRNVAEGAQAVLLLDRSGWHTTSKLDGPDNITPIFLLSRSPELNPVRERLAISPPELALKHRIRELRRDRRRRLRHMRKLIAHPERSKSIGMARLR
jgi:hypothetical protein